MDGTVVTSLRLKYIPSTYGVLVLKSILSSPSKIQSYFQPHDLVRE